MNRHQVNSYIEKRVKELKGVKNPWATIKLELKGKGITLSRDAIQKRSKRMGIEAPAKVLVEPTLDDKVEESNKDRKQRIDKKVLKESLTEVGKLQRIIEASEIIHGNQSAITIKGSGKKGGSESTAVAVWSDWHVEENITAESTNGLNEFTLAIADQRIDRLIRKTVDFVKMYQQDTRINTMVLALLGDFISGDIHDELMETAEVPPTEAIVWVQKRLIGGIKYILDNTDLNLVIPCHSGNHARTTKKVHISTEYGHSLEFIMYQSMATYFESEKRVEFRIPKSYLSYVKVYDWVLRLHHGHALKYGGGIGGLFIPTYKAVGNWNKAIRADLDLFGHFHQTKDGDSFYCNGSLIGYAPYALSIKADYEPAKQNFFLINETLGRTIMSPIHLQNPEVP